MFGEVLIVLDGHVLLHIEFGENLRDNNLIALRTVQVEVGCIYLPMLVLLDLLVKVVNCVMNVDMQVGGDLGHDLLGLTLEGGKVVVALALTQSDFCALVGVPRAALIDCEDFGTVISIWLCGEVHYVQLGRQVLLQGVDFLLKTLEELVGLNELRNRASWPGLSPTTMPAN